MPFESYETVVGLECHVQLNTQTKLFSPAINRYGDEPNTNVDVVDLGLPGVLPVMNDQVVDFAVRLGLALNCTIHHVSEFSRKHYFYPDLPKGYQISQFDKPICTGGYLDIEVDGETRRIGITRIHIEEDAGKNLHIEGGNTSLCDYNRAGTPLLEVVSEPDFRSGAEAMVYYRTLRQICMYLGICDGNLQEGSMRADANVSVRKWEAPEFGQRTETKNINSPRYLMQAVEYEARRQVLEIEGGGKILQETRLWDPNLKETRSMRSKEDAQDYRYFPDPDLLPLVVPQERIDSVQDGLPELPAAKRERLLGLGISADNAQVLCEEVSTANYFESALSFHDNPKSISNWVVNDVLRFVKQSAKGVEGEEVDLALCPIPPKAVGELVKLIDDKVITGKIAKDVFAELEQTPETSPLDIVERKGWKVERDTGKLEGVIADIIEAHPIEVEKYRGGKTKVFGFFVGQVMRATKGQADPEAVNAILKSKLDT